MTQPPATDGPATDRPALHSWTARAAAVAALAVGAGMLTLLPGGSPPASAAGLVPWRDCDALLEHYRAELARSASPWGLAGAGAGGLRLTEQAMPMSGMGGAAMDAVAAPAPVAAAEGSAGAATGSAVGSGPTGTNVQEAGVDEPDVVKLAGDLLVASAGGRLQVLRAGAQPELLSSVSLGDGVAVAELLVDGDRVLAIGTGWRSGPDGGGGGVPVPMPMPVEPGTGGDVEVPPVPPVEPPVEPLVEPPVEPSVLPSGEPPALPPVATPEPVPPTEPTPLPEPDVVAGSPDVAAADVAVRAVPPPPGVLSAPIGIAPPGEQLVRVVLVDLAEPAAPKVLETLELDGRYVSARLVDGTVRLVTSSAPQLAGVQPAEPYGPAQEQAALEQNREAAEQAGVDDVLPNVVRRGPDGTELSGGPAVDCTAVQRAEDRPTGGSTLLVTTLRPASGLRAVDSTAVTTDGDLVYASADRLYVATSRWGTVAPVDARGSAPASDDVTSELHAFDTSAPDRTRYVGSGSVRGFLYGRWALSEHEGDLRVATTLQPPWDGSGQSSSSVVVLGEDGDRLVERGRLDGLGQDERIYAVRYFGDIATVVTFRETDPLYVLDLGDPERPRLLGELKIPGFSTYLHPVGDDRLLAVGQDADERGRVTGFQLSLFDLTDLSRPAQVDRLSLGEGYSPASEDSRAFSYDPAQRLAALPFMSYDPRTGASQSSALGVRVTEDFRLEEAGRLDVGPSTMVQRVLLGGGLAYAVTPEGVVAAQAASMARTGSAAFAGADPVSAGTD